MWQGGQGKAVSRNTLGNRLVCIPDRHQPHLSVTTMPLKITNDLSVLELLRLLNEKLGLECTRLREIRVSPAISVTSLELEVSTSVRLITRKILVAPTDRESRNESTRRPEVDSASPQPVAAGE